MKTLKIFVYSLYLIFVGISVLLIIANIDLVLNWDGGIIVNPVAFVIIFFSGFFLFIRHMFRANQYPKVKHQRRGI